MDTILRHMSPPRSPPIGPKGMGEVLKIARSFEEKIYVSATDQQDYLRKLSLKMLSLETKAREAIPATPIEARLRNYTYKHGAAKLEPTFLGAMLSLETREATPTTPIEARVRNLTSSHGAAKLESTFSGAKTYHRNLPSEIAELQYAVDLERLVKLVMDQYNDKLEGHRQLPIQVAPFLPCSSFIKPSQGKKCNFKVGTGLLIVEEEERRTIQQKIATERENRIRTEQDLNFPQPLSREPALEIEEAVMEETTEDTTLGKFVLVL